MWAIHAVLLRCDPLSFYGVESFDTITFIIAATSMLLASLAACAGPLFRPTMVDPAVAVRAE